MGKIRQEKKVEVEEEMDEGESMDEEQDDVDFDKRSVISNKTIKSLVSKKKDKMKLKRQFLLKRLHAAHQSKREAKERAARRQTVIVSDMKDQFENSLGQIESYLEEQRLAMSKKKPSRKQIPSQTERNRQSQTNIDIFHKISQSTEYSANPFELIKNNWNNRSLHHELFSSFWNK